MSIDITAENCRRLGGLPVGWSLSFESGNPDWDICPAIRIETGHTVCGRGDDDLDYLIIVHQGQTKLLAHDHGEIAPVNRWEEAIAEMVQHFKKHTQTEVEFNPLHIIAVRRSYYTGTLTNDRGWQVLTDGKGMPHVGDYRSMRETVRGLDDLPYHLANGECGRPRYRVTSVNSQFGKQLLKRSGWTEDVLTING